MISLWFNSGGFPSRFGVFSQCKRRYPYGKDCTPGASQKFSWKQLVTYLAHSKEHCKTNLAEYWGWCTVGQVTSRTMGAACSSSSSSSVGLNVATSSVFITLLPLCVICVFHTPVEVISVVERRTWDLYCAQLALCVLCTLLRSDRLWWVCTEHCWMLSLIHIWRCRRWP